MIQEVHSAMPPSLTVGAVICWLLYLFPGLVILPLFLGTNALRELHRFYVGMKHFLLFSTFVIVREVVAPEF